MFMNTLKCQLEDVDTKLDDNRISLNIYLEGIWFQKDGTTPHFASDNEIHQYKHFLDE